MEAGVQDIESRPSLASCGTAPPCVGQPGKAPNTHHTLDRNIFFKTCCIRPKVRPINHPSCRPPKKQVGASSLGLPIALPQCKKGLCATGAEEWRQVPGVGRAPSSVCSGISYYLLSRSRRSSCLHHHCNRQSVWVEGGVRLASFLSDNLQRPGPNCCMNSIHKTPWDFCPLPDFALPQ